MNYPDACPMCLTAGAASSASGASSPAAAIASGASAAAVTADTTASAIPADTAARITAADQSRSIRTERAVHASIAIRGAAGNSGPAAVRRRARVPAAVLDAVARQAGVAPTIAAGSSRHAAVRIALVSAVISRRTAVPSASQHSERRSGLPGRLGGAEITALSHPRDAEIAVFRHTRTARVERRASLQIRAGAADRVLRQTARRRGSKTSL